MTAADALGIQERMRKFNEALLGEDELGAVVRGHIYIENELIALINNSVFDTLAIQRMDLDYSSRVKLAVALGLSKDFEPALNFVGSLRNNLAHRLDFQIGKKEANAFEKALGAHAAIMHAAHKTAHINLGTGEHTIPVKAREPRDRITLGFVTLWAGIAVAAHQAAQARATETPTR